MIDLHDGLYSLIQSALTFNDATVVEQGDEWLVVNDNSAHILYICTDDAPCAARLLREHLKLQPTVSILAHGTLPICLCAPFTQLRETLQYAYHGAPLPVRCPLPILPMTMEDMPYFRAHYYRNGNDEEYLLSAIGRGMFKVMDGEETVGFVGEHPEHALGLLYVADAYRRRGIGKALMCAMINKMLAEGKTPVEHVIKSNEAGKQVPASIEGMSADKGTVYWLF